MPNKARILIVSDGTGQTVRQVIKAAMAQFPSEDIYLSRHKYIKTMEQVSDIINDAKENHDLIIHTIINEKIREQVNRECSSNHIRCVDLIGQLLKNLSNIFESSPSNLPGELHDVNEQYFKKVDALEFTLNHDDGKNIETLKSADIILVGVSRTSKTPLSILLALEGYKVVNIPLVHKTQPPPDLFKIDQKKIFALTINPMELYKIRIKRTQRLGIKSANNEYSNQEEIDKEIHWSELLFKENKLWPVIDVTNKAIEETMSEVLRHMELRSKKYF